MAKPTFLGLDLSTQSLTALIVDPADGGMVRHSLGFDREMPHYGTSDGVLFGESPTEAVAPPMMWVEAMDRMLLMLKDEGLTGRIKAVSVSAQQHGSVYLNGRAESRLTGLTPDRPLHEQLGDIYSRPLAPIWMDSSTSEECREITDELGGVKELVRLTGSPATERFAGPQIRKFWKQNPGAYDETVHIALVSSFITTLLIGRPAPLDCGDGLGMNLVDLYQRDWNQAALNASAPDLRPKLPEVLDRDREVGRVSAYMSERYGFDPDCRVIVGTGDNPASLVGLGLVGNEETRAVSLGTSDTYFGYISELSFRQRSIGHVFGAADGGLMFLLCFKNGSLARERVRDDHGLDWNGFSDILLNTPPGNGGRVMLPYFWPEITPVVLEPGVVRFGGLTEDDAAGNVRAVAEAQVMAMFLHSNWTGLRPRRILVTAGGSGNRGLLKLIAQVFGARVEAFEVSDGAALGAAVRAAGCWLKQQGEAVELSELSRNLVGAGHSEIIDAPVEETSVFRGEDGLLDVYAACERYHLGAGPDPKPLFERFRSRYC